MTNLVAMLALCGACLPLVAACSREGVDAKRDQTAPDSSPGHHGELENRAAMGPEPRREDALRIEAPAITEERLASFLACERTVLGAMAPGPVSEAEVNRRLDRVRRCGFESLPEWEAFRSRVEAVRAWRLHLQAHAATDTARLQTKARLDESVAAGRMSAEQRDLALSFFPNLASPDRPRLDPPLSESEEAVIRATDLNTLAPRGVPRRQ